MALAPIKFSGFTAVPLVSIDGTEELVGFKTTDNIRMTADDLWGFFRAEGGVFSSAIELPNGSISAPSLKFAYGSGIYAESASKISFSVSSVVNLSVTTTSTNSADFVAERIGAGSVILAHDLSIPDGVSNGQVRYFRQVNTSGNLEFNIVAGNGTTQVNHVFSARSNSTMCRFFGNLGIGSTGTPSQTLTVTGNIGISNVEIIDANRHFRFRQYAAASLPTQDSGDFIASSDTFGILVSDGTRWKSPGVINAQANNANITISVPAGWAIVGIYFENTTANVVTGGVKIGTTSGAVDVVAAQAVGANEIGHITDATILKKLFSSSSAQTLFIQPVTSWNSAVVDFGFDLRKVM